jgi:hypothetical protein
MGITKLIGATAVCRDWGLKLPSSMPRLNGFLFSREIIASLLTTDHVGDEIALQEVLQELVTGIEDRASKVLADGAYDGTGVSECLTNTSGPDVEIIIPLPRTAVTGLNEKRDAHIKQIAANGRTTWQAETGYKDRALVEV